MQVPLYIFVKPVFYLVAVIVFWQTVRRKADSRWCFALIVSVLFVISVGLSVYEIANPVDAVVAIAGASFSYMLVRALLENVGLFAIVSLLLALLTMRLASAQRDVRLLAQIAASSTDAIVAIDNAGRVTSWNLGAEMLLGYYSDEIVGSDVERLVREDFLDAFDNALGRCRRDGFVKGLSCPMVAKGRKNILTEVTLSAIVDEAGAPAGISLFLRDVTEQRKIEQELLQSSKMTAMGTMAAGIVHEFGNLLTVISGRAQLGRTSKNVEEARVAFDAVEACAARAKSVTNNLLAYAKRQKPQKTCGNISAAIDAAVALLEKELQRENINVKRNYQALPETDFDHEQMTQVFINLIVNALNAMREGGGEIEIGTSVKNTYIEAELRDNGPGIPEEIMANLFEPFSTTGGGDGKPRTGLGLFVCHEIVKFHSGSISVESGKGKGTSFRVYLPITRGGEDAGPSDTRVIEKGQCRAAVIDRDTMIRDLLTEALRRRGIKARAFQDASSARAAAVSTEFDIIFVDVSIKNGDGRRLVEQLKSENGAAVVAMIGEAVDAEEFKKLKEGTLQTLRKPFGLDDINAVCNLVVTGGKPQPSPAEKG